MRILESIRRRTRRSQSSECGNCNIHCTSNDDASNVKRKKITRISPPPILPPIRPSSHTFLSSIDIRISTMSAQIVTSVDPPVNPPVLSPAASPESPTRPPRPPSLALSTLLTDITPTVLAPTQRLRRVVSYAQLRLLQPKETRFQLHSYSSDSSLSQIHAASRVIDSAWLIPIHALHRGNYNFDYQFGGTIGEGGFAKIMLGLHIDTKQVYAVKIIALRRLRTVREAESVINEIRTLRHVMASKSSFLAKPGMENEWYWQYLGNVHIVMEYYPGGNLGSTMQCHKELRNPPMFKLMTAEVVLGILALHSMGIIHNDIKPTNILVDSRGHCVLTDFGCSCFTSNARSSGTLGGYPPLFTLRYAAPEALTHGVLGLNFGPVVDFWSLGATLFELATGKELIDETDEHVVVYKIRNELIDMAQTVFLIPYPGLRSFVEALLEYDTVVRLQDSTIKKHEYFSEYLPEDWEAIAEKKRPPFRPDKQVGIDPHNTTYEYIERPGESTFEPKYANEDIVNRWFVDLGVNIPHHRLSETFKFHGRNARVGLPYEPVPHYSSETPDSDIDNVSLKYF